MAEFTYQVGDRVRVDRAVLEDHEEAVPGFTKQFEDLDDVRGTVYYIRKPYQFRNEEPRVEPTVCVSFTEIHKPWTHNSYSYFPHELSLISRGVNPEELAKLSQELADLAEKFRALTN